MYFKTLKCKVYNRKYFLSNVNVDKVREYVDSAIRSISLLIQPLHRQGPVVLCLSSKRGADVSVSRKMFALEPCRQACLCFFSNAVYTAVIPQFSKTDRYPFIAIISVIFS